MGKRAPKGWIRLDDIKLEGGIVVTVNLDKNEGIFHAEYSKILEMENGQHHDGETWKGKDLEKIREDVQKWHKEQKALKWEPVIVVKPAEGFGHHRRKVLGQEFERLMRAPMHTGKGYEWRSWAYQKPDGGFLYDKDLEVYGPGGQDSEPTKGFHSDVKPVIMPYTPERWKALLQLVKMEAALRDRLEGIVKGGNEQLENFLLKVPQMGLMGLTPKPGKEKKKA
jgi:hypothetical protein